MGYILAKKWGRLESKVGGGSLKWGAGPNLRESARSES